MTLTTLPKAPKPSYPYIYLSTYVTIYIYLRDLSLGSGGPDHLAECAETQLSLYLPIYLSIYLVTTYIYLLNRAWVSVALTALPNALSPSYPYIYLSTCLSTL